MWATALEVIQVFAVAARIERARLSEGPVPLIARLRAEGRRRRPRDAAGRAGLARAVRLVDRLFPEGPNCYRRVLFEVALDPAAAREPICLGLKAGGGPGSGHAFFARDRATEPAAQGLEAIFEV